MAVAKAIRRLLRVLDLVEELRRRVLETAQSELACLEQALSARGEQEQNGRRWLASGLQSGDLADRVAGLEEIQTGKRIASALKPQIDQSASRVEECREAFLAKRVERRQAETLVKAAEGEATIEANRKAQQGLDDWYLAGTLNERKKEKPENES